MGVSAPSAQTLGARSGTVVSKISRGMQLLQPGPRPLQRNRASPEVVPRIILALEPIENGSDRYTVWPEDSLVEFSLPDRYRHGAPGRARPA